MGCYTHIHSIDKCEDLGALSRLPRSVAWRLFRSKQHDRLFLDHGIDPADAWSVEHFSNKPFFGGGTMWEPFTFKLDARHEYLNDLATKPGMAEQMCRPMVKYTIMLSNLVQGRVFTAIADDDSHDSVCIAERGKVTRLRFSNGDETITVDAKGAITSSPETHQHYGDVAAEEAARLFGYRLAYLEDIQNFMPDPDDYELVARSAGGKHRHSSLLLVLLRPLWRGPY